MKPIPIKIKYLFLLVCMIFICSFSVSAANINKTTLKLWKNETYQLKVSGKVAWSSGSPSVATVVNGKVKAKKAGTAKIYAKSGTKTLATCTVTVKNAPTISGASESWVYVKDKKQPDIKYKKTFTVSNSFSSPVWTVNTKKYVSLSAKNNTATVSAFGPTKGNGTTVLTATVKSDASTKKFKRTIRTKLYPRLESSYSVKEGASIKIPILNTSSKAKIYSCTAYSDCVSVTCNGPVIYLKGIKMGTAKLKVKLNKGEIVLKTVVNVKSAPGSDTSFWVEYEDEDRVEYDTAGMSPQEKIAFQTMYKFMITPSKGGDFATDVGYPEGRSCTDKDSYQYKGGIYGGGHGCGAFALRLNDAVYDAVSKKYPNSINSKAKMIKSYSPTTYKLKVGDVVRLDFNTHVVIVLQRKTEDGIPGVVVAEGNYNCLGQVHWGRFIPLSEIKRTFTNIVTRW